MRFALAEHGDEHVGPRHLVPPRRLHVDRGALHHALERRRGLRLARPVRRQSRQILVQELGQIRAELVQIDAAGPQHGGRVAVVGQPEQQVFEGRILVAAIACERQGAMECLLEIE